MQNNKVLKRVVETVLVLVVLICGMFCLTACTDEGKINDLNSKIEKLEKQLKNSSDVENELMLTKSVLCAINTLADFEKPMTLATNPIERETSSVGLPYEGLSSVIELEDLTNRYNDFLQYRIFLECLINAMNNDTGSFECGKIYQDTQNLSGGTVQLIIEIDAQKKNITGYMKVVNGACMEITINVNDNFTDWQSIVVKNIISSHSTMATVVNGKKDGLVFSSFNQIVFESNGVFADFMCYDIDTNYKIILNNEMEEYQTEKAFLSGKYLATLNSTATNINNAFNGKTNITEIDFFNTIIS